MSTEGERERLERIADRLRELELDEMEIRIYLALLPNGSSQAGPIISLTGASRGTVYRVLGDMVDRGILHKSVGKPATYQAVAPDELFEQALEEIEHRRRYVELLRNQLSGPLEQLATDEGPPVEPTWARLEGRDSIFRAVRSALDEAGASIDVLSTHPVIRSRAPAVEKTWSTVLGQGAEDVSVRVLTEEPQELRTMLEGIGDPGSMRIRPIETSSVLHFYLVDEQEVVFWLVPSPRSGIHTGDDAAVRTDAPGLVGICQSFFASSWDDERGTGNAGWFASTNEEREGADPGPLV